MKQKNAYRSAFQVAAILVVLFMLSGYLLIPLAAAGTSIYIPLIYRSYLVGEELNLRLLISEVMNNPSGQEPGLEWIEIYNRSIQRINLVGHKIGDSETRGDSEGMVHFPEGSIIEPGQVVVIANQGLLFSQVHGFQPDYELLDSDQSIPDMVKYRDWAGGAINLNNAGDEVLLLNQDDIMLDAISWGNSLFAFIPSAPISKDGQSLERIPANSDRNRAADWDIQPTPQPGTVNLSLPTPESSPTPTDLPPSCYLASLLITEVLYDPSHSTDPVGEWIEVFNWGESSIYLGCLLLGDEETIGGGEGMFTFPPDSSIRAGEVIIIANQATDFFTAYGFDPDYEFVETNPLVPDMVKFNSWAAGSVNLSNSGDDVLLVGVDKNLIDTVSWGNSIFAFVPSGPSVDAGRSIARQPADMDTNSAQDWLEQTNPQPGIIELDHPIPTPNHTSTSTATKKPTTLPPSPTKKPTRTRTPTSTKTPTRTSTQTPTQTPTPSEQPLPVLVINEIHADPHSSLGDANYDGVVNTADDEFIEFVNDSQSSLDISGWTLEDALKIRHTFPPGSIIAPHCGIVVFGGGAPNGVFGNSVVQIASSGNLGFNDYGDIISLYDTTMVMINSITYGEEAGDDQSITRDPDIIGEKPLRKHSLASGSNGSLFSPGTKIDGSYFSGCSE